MSDSPVRPTRQDDSYEEFARKMQLIEDGPTTTNFQQLVDRGIELPPPDDLAIADVTTKLWEVINGLAQLRVYLDCTDHLTDPELYSKLWHDTLRTDVSAKYFWAERVVHTPRRRSITSSIRRGGERQQIPSRVLH